MKFGRGELNRLLAMGPDIADILPPNAAGINVPDMSKDMKKAVALARKFNEEVVKPAYKKIDQAVQMDHDYLPLEFIKTANEWGLYTLWIPKMFGGAGWHIASIYVFLEEIASCCCGLSNVIGVHYLGVCSLMTGFNMKIIKKVFGEVVQGEKTGVPCLISLALTEPAAGSDVEENELVEQGKVGTIARRVEGGYQPNGSKCFISGGHYSTWHITVCYEDRKRPAETFMLFAIRNGMPGFSFGAKENKMGQKACVASELIYEDVFVPDDLVMISSGKFKDIGVSYYDVSNMTIESALAATRVGVSAFACGVARGAYEAAVEYAEAKIVGGKRLINHQYAQNTLAEMDKNVAMARLTYVQAAQFTCIWGLFRVLYQTWSYWPLRVLPKSVQAIVVKPFLNLKLTTNIIRKMYYNPKNLKEYQAAIAWASMAKFAVSDTGLLNCMLATQLMGVDGTRQDHNLEKHLRDSKLLQIYEGTNQLNRQILFKHLIARDIAGVEMFAKKKADDSVESVHMLKQRRAIND